jgi:hypothetical protein
MGRLPSTFGGLPIQQRIPWAITGELALTASQPAQQYPDATFANAGNKTFEIHRMIPRVYGQIADVLYAPQPEMSLLLAMVRVQITDLALDQKITKAPTLLDSLVKGSSELSWEFAEPHNLPNNGQLQITLDTLAFPAQAPFTTITKLKTVLTFEGFLIVTSGPVA